MSTSGRSTVAAVIATQLALLGGGCALGPDFHSPAAPKTGRYTPDPQPEATTDSAGSGGAAQSFVTGRDIPADWYSLFQSSTLDELVREGLRDSPTIEAAQAALRSAQATYSAERGALLLPTVDGQAAVTRERVPGAAFGNPALPASLFTLYNASVSVSYRVDLFGASRRQLENLRAQADYQRWQLEAANLTLTGNIVTTAFDIASLQGQLAAVKDVVEKESELYTLAQRQFEAGGISKSDVLAQQSQLAQARTLVPALEQALAQAQHRLAVLTGHTPDQAVPDFRLDQLRLPAELPLSVPAQLVRQRPDIRSAEAVLEQASAAVGVATANLFPQLNLTGSIGTEAVKAGSLFGAGTGTWNAGASLLQPLFHGGELRYKRKAALANLEQADANYRQTVLTALQQVADTLRALEADARNLRAQTEYESASLNAFDIARKQWRVGGISYITVLNAQRLYLQAHQSRVQAEATRYADSAALFQALGGGWWNRDGQQQKVAQQ